MRFDVQLFDIWLLLKLLSLHDGKRIPFFVLHRCLMHANLGRFDLLKGFVLRARELVSCARVAATRALGGDRS